MTTPEAHGGVQSVARALDVLEVVTVGGSVGVTEVGRRTGLKLSTAHGIMRTLASRGYLDRDGQKYRIGPAALALASKWSQVEDLGPYFEPLLKELSEKVGAASTATILVGREAKIVSSVSAPGILGMKVEQQNWRDPFMLATGQVLVASNNSSTWEDLISRTTVAPTLHSSWKKVLEFTRERGVGYNLTRDPRGTVGVAMPVFGKGQSAVCSVGLYSPAFLSADIFSTLALETLWSTCAQASDYFGGELPERDLPKAPEIRRHLPTQMLNSP